MSGAMDDKMVIRSKLNDPGGGEHAKKRWIPMCRVTATTLCPHHRPQVAPL